MTRSNALSMQVFPRLSTIRTLTHLKWSDGRCGANIIHANSRVILMMPLQKNNKKYKIKRD